MGRRRPQPPTNLLFLANLAKLLALLKDTILVWGAGAMSMKRLFATQVRLDLFRGCALGFALVVWVLTLRSWPEQKLPPSDFASREADVRAALAMHFGRISNEDVIRASDFSKLPANPEMIKFPTLLVNKNGEHCFAIGAAVSAGGDSLFVRCIDRKGSIIRRSWPDLTSEATGMLSVQKDRVTTAKVGKGEVQLSWLVWDFGPTTSNHAYTADFRLLNIGALPVVIRQVRQSCTCVETRHKNDLPMTVTAGEAAEFAFVVQQITQTELSLQAILEVDCDGARELLQLRILATDGHSTG